MWVQACVGEAPCGGIAELDLDSGAPSIGEQGQQQHGRTGFSELEQPLVVRCPGGFFEPIAQGEPGRDIGHRTRRCGQPQC